MARVGLQFVVTVELEVNDADTFEVSSEAATTIEGQLKYSINSRKAQLTEELGDVVIVDTHATFEDVTT